MSVWTVDTRVGGIEALPRHWHTVLDALARRGVLLHAGVAPALMDVCDQLRLPTEADPASVLRD